MYWIGLPVGGEERSWTLDFTTSVAEALSNAKNTQKLHVETTDPADNKLANTRPELSEDGCAG